MPDKPLWLARLPHAIQQLESLSDGWVDRPLLESLLAIGRRRAQQLLSPVATRRIGTSALARREDLVAWLKQIASGETAGYEDRRRRQLWSKLGGVREQWIEQPPVLVEVADQTLRRVRDRDFEGLPEGVELDPGQITVRFSTPEEALEKLVALAMAISHNRSAFDDRVALLPEISGNWPRRRASE